MNDGQFLAVCDEAFDQIESLLDTLQAEGANFEYASGTEGVLEIELGNGAHVMINRHVAAREIWVAEPGGGFHFGYGEAGWVDTRSGVDLFNHLRRLLA